MVATFAWGSFGGRPGQLWGQGQLWGSFGVRPGLGAALGSDRD
jgi:hypothetical protein